MVRLAERLRKARVMDRAEHQAGEKERLGNLRGGNSGIMSPDGEIAAHCHRLSHLRQLGIEVEEPDYSKLIMFERGYNNEDMIYEDLRRTLEPGEILLREEEIPTSWETTNGTKVTGRPDVVICKPEMAIIGGKHQISNLNPILGLEIKSLASFWSAKTVLFDSQPKLSNLVQAAHYMWQLNIPFRLVYRQYANLIVPDWGWLHKQLPRSSEGLGKHIKWDKKTGKARELLPFELVYEIEFHKGRLRYRLEDGGTWQSTVITSEDIVRYYEFLSHMGEQKTLGPRPATLDAQGDKLNYSICSYCPLEPICDSKEALGYDIWLSEVRISTVKGVK